MESHNSELQDSHALTSFLVIDYLQKEGVSQHLLDKLSTELSQKGIFKSMITMDGRPQHCTFGDLKSQFPPPTTPLIKNMVQHQYHKQKEVLEIKQEKESIIRRIKEEHNIINARKRRDVLTRRSSLKSLLRSREEYENFPPEIFTEYWGKLKTFFGHLKREIDPEDPLNGSPVYNLSYDKNGKFIVTAADDGIIKIWSTYNGELINTLIGHNTDINATSLSDCGNYLASCSNESMIKIWHLETGCPIAAFNDHEGVVCSVNFFSMPVTNKPGEKHRKGLVSAADDGTIMVYFEDDYINNGGIYKQNQKKMKLKADDTVKGFCSIDVHPDGFIAAGTSGGSIVIWNRLLDIDTRRIERHRIIKKEHYKDCHLTVWNKDGTKLISASFDGTAKAWPWNKAHFESNRNMEALFILESELGKGPDIKCCAVSWSCRGRYAIASFSKKLNRSTEDNEVIRGNIQVYDLNQNKRTFKFENTYDKGQFENYIFIIEAHPFNEAIIMSADYDGKIIIWDIEHGHMLNIFVEDCSHLGFPLCQAPILDGKFSPDGLSFCVTNYHGSFSIYGYGDRDLFLTTPTEQFFMKEFGEYDLEPTTSQVISLDNGLESHFVEKGPLCSSKKKVYTEDFTEHSYFNDFDEERWYKRFMKAMTRKKTESRPSQEGLNTQNCLKALKEKINDTINQKTEKALEDYYQELTEKKSEGGSLGPTTDTSYQSSKLSQGQIKKLLRSNIEGFNLKFDEEKTELQSQEEKPKRLATISNRLNESRMHELESLLEAREDEAPRRPKSEQDFQEEEEEQSIQPTRRRRVRRMLLEDTQDLSEENIFTQSPKSVKEERSEEKTVQQQRKHRRLILDDEEAADETTQIQETKPVVEEKKELRPRVRMEEENFDSLEERPEETSTSLVRSQSRELSGRRDRQLASNSFNVRQAVATNQNMRASRARTLQLQQQQQQAVEEILCARCGLENARITCHSECGRAYHSACSKRHGRENDRGIFNCFSCLDQSRKKEKPNGAKVLRAWANKDVNDKTTYLPQVGDLVTYVFQAHEDFVLHYFDFLRFSKGEVFPFEKQKGLQQDNICKIVNIAYQFPLSPRWYKGQLNILMKVILETVENGTLSGNTFTVTYFQSEACDFIIPRDLFVLCIHNAVQLRHEQAISYHYHGEIKQGILAEVSPREEGPFPNSHWKSLRIVEQEDGGHSVRKSRKDPNETGIYISPWEVYWGDLSFIMKADEDITKEFVDWAIREIHKLYENNTEQYEVFMEEVDKDTYKDYPQIVVFEMNIDKIKRRLANFFYRHKDAIIADIRLIMLNCCEYNDPTSIIAVWSKELIEKMIRIINPYALNEPMREHTSKRQETHRRRTRFYEESKDKAGISVENIIPDLSNEERPMPRTRARKLVLQEEEEHEQEKPKKFAYPSLEKEAQSHTIQQNVVGRLRRGTRNERKEEAPASVENEGLLRNKVKRKEMEFMDKMKMQTDEPEEYGEEEDEEDLEEKAQLHPMHMNLRHQHQKPPQQENPVNNNYRGRLRQKDSKKLTQYFGEDSGNEEDVQPEVKIPVNPVIERVERVERREEPVYHHNHHYHHNPAPVAAAPPMQLQQQHQQYQQQQQRYQEPPSHFPDLNTNDDFLHGFLYNGIEPTHPEFLDQELPFQDSAAIKGERSQEKPFEYKVDYNAPELSQNSEDKKPQFDDGYFMVDNIEIFADRDENNAEESMPMQTSSIIPTINNNNDNAWGLNGKRATYERRYSSDQELSNSGFGSLFESDSMSTGSKHKGNYQNPLAEEGPQTRYQPKIFKGSDDEDSDFDQGARRQAKNKRLKI